MAAAVASAVLNGVLLRIGRATPAASTSTSIDWRGSVPAVCLAAAISMAMYRGPDGVLWAAGTASYWRDANSDWHCVPLHRCWHGVDHREHVDDGWLRRIRVGQCTGLWRYAKDGTLTLVEGTRSRNDGAARTIRRRRRRAHHPAARSGSAASTVRPGPGWSRRRHRHTNDLPRGGVLSPDAGRGDTGLPD